MKNELLARAMTEIDDALIAEANERPARSKVTHRTLLQAVYRWGTIAACALLVLGVVIAGNLGSNDVLLYGESITDQSKMINMPRAIAHMIDTEIPLELEFKKETTLTLTEGVMTVLDGGGEVVFEGSEYTVRGSISMILTLPAEATEALIETDRGYNIVLTKDIQSGNWYVNIQK